MKYQTHKKWICPRLYLFSKEIISSGNPADTRPGEFIVQPALTSCPFSGATCVPMGSYLVYSTGKIDNQVICYGDGSQISTALYLPVCS